MSILYLKMATSSKVWSLFCTVQHVFKVKSSASGLKYCWCVYAESKRYQSCWWSSFKT